MKFSYWVSTPHFIRELLLHEKVGLLLVGVSEKPSVLAHCPPSSKVCCRPK